MLVKSISGAFSSEPNEPSRVVGQKEEVVELQRPTAQSHLNRSILKNPKQFRDAMRVSLPEIIMEVE